MRAIEITLYVTAQDIMAAVHCSRSTAYKYLREAGGGGEGLVRVSKERWEEFARQRFEGQVSPAHRRKSPAPAPPPASAPRPRLRLVASNGNGLEVRPTQPRRKKA